MVALPLPVLAVTTSVGVALAVGVVGGAGALIVEVVADTRLQQTLDESRLGCAYGFAFAASLGGIAVGGLIAPVLVALAGLGGALCLIAATVLALASVHRAARRPAADAGRRRGRRRRCRGRGREGLRTALVRTRRARSARSPSRWATPAASTRVRASSLARMRVMWTVTVFGLM